MNVRLLRRIAKVIQEKPRQFDIKSWHRDRITDCEYGDLGIIGRRRSVSCNTTHCIAGWAQILSREADANTHARDEAVRVLEISEDQATRLFYSEHWPKGFGRSRATAAQAAARIKHFIKTKGAE